MTFDYILHDGILIWHYCDYMTFLLHTLQKHLTFLFFWYDLFYNLFYIRQYYLFTAYFDLLKSYFLKRFNILYATKRFKNFVAVFLLMFMSINISSWSFLTKIQNKTQNHSTIKILSFNCCSSHTHTHFLHDYLLHLKFLHIILIHFLYSEARSFHLQNY